MQSRKGICKKMNMILKNTQLEKQNLKLILLGLTFTII
jgi:hypothetical protein